jgi:putative membrane protein
MTFLVLIPFIVMGVILLVSLIAVKNRGNIENGTPRSNRNAMQILDERFARGEIDEAEYVRKKTVLQR